MESANQFRIACEECHERKIKCKQSGNQGSGVGSCESCHLNGRRCLFSLKSKTGRPKASRAAASVSSIQTVSISPLKRNQSLSMDSASTSNTISFGSQKTRGGFNNPMQSNFHKGQISDLTFEQPLQSPSIFTADMNSNQYWQPSGNFGNEPGASTSVFSLKTRPEVSLETPQVAPVAPMRDPSFSAGPDIFINHFAEMPTQGRQGNPTPNHRGENLIPFDLPTEDVHSMVELSKSEPICDTTVASQCRKSASVSEFLRALELSHELRWHCDSMSGRALSLLSDGDAQDVRSLLDSLDKLCTKIATMISSPQQEDDKSTYILVFAAVMEVIDQTIRRLSCIVELDPRFDPGRSTLIGSILSDEFDMNMDAFVFTSDSALEDQLLSPCPPDFIGGTLIDTGLTSLPEIEMEHLLSLTRLDYYLLRFKSFISHFDSSPDLVAAATFMFSPSQSTAQLLSFHRCIEGILAGWRTKWCK